MDDEVLIGAGKGYWHSGWSEEELLGPLPSPPEFEEPIERVRERISKTVGKVTVPREVRIWHPTVEKLLKEDEQRRERQRASSFPSSWGAPRFDTPFERRRLRVLNAVVLALGMMSGKSSISDHEGRSIHVTVHQRHIAIHWTGSSGQGTGEMRQIQRTPMKRSFRCRFSRVPARETSAWHGRTMSRASLKRALRRLRPK
jgi:hypothetical protein